ncbi:MAG TPA: hypothetical protein VF177_18155 [Anaerolineae bacterium]
MTLHKLYLLLVITLAVQTAHYAEHVAQVIQIYSLGIAPPHAHGLLGHLFDFEWVHFLYNVGLEMVLAVLWLSYRASRRESGSPYPSGGILLLTSLVLFQGYHSVEHLTKLYQYLFLPLYQSGLPPTPGLLPTLTGWPIFLVHFWLNTMVWVGLVAAVWQLRPGMVGRTAVPPLPLHR